MHLYNVHVYIRGMFVKTRNEHAGGVQEDMVLQLVACAPLLQLHNKIGWSVAN